MRVLSNLRGSACQSEKGSAVTDVNKAITHDEIADLGRPDASHVSFGNPVIKFPKIINHSDMTHEIADRQQSKSLNEGHDMRLC